ncbi:hypothetical protein TNCV_3781931 [Trichonephila clavipes]|nr:hypothetical protein TNCV_3781931 [Trichonephila clavipes]
MHRLCDGLRKKWCLLELNLDHVVPITISGMRTGNMRGMKIMLDGSRTHTECRHFLGVQLYPRGITSIASLMPPPSSTYTPNAAMTPFIPIKSVIWPEPELCCMPLVHLILFVIRQQQQQQITNFIRFWNHLLEFR